MAYLPLHSHTDLFSCTALRVGIQKLMNQSSGPQLGRRLSSALTLHSVPTEAVLLHKGGPFQFRLKLDVTYSFQPESSQVKTFSVATEWQRIQEENI